MKRISITSEIDLDALAEQLVDCTDYAETVALIKRIDARIADLAFTCELARHFAEEVKRETDENGDRLLAVVDAVRTYLTAPPAGHNADEVWDPPFDAYEALCAAMKAYDGTEPRDPGAAS